MVYQEKILKRVLEVTVEVPQVFVASFVGEMLVASVAIAEVTKVLVVSAFSSVVVAALTPSPISHLLTKGECQYPKHSQGYSLRLLVSSQELHSLTEPPNSLMEKSHLQVLLAAEV